MATASQSSQHETGDFLSGGGELSDLIRAFDWSATPLGPASGWPQSIRTTVALVLRSPVPIVTLWGEDGIMIYNDAYSVFAGGRHPTLLGSKVREGWPEVADFNDNVMKTCLKGETLSYTDQELTLHRHGRPEQVWMNLDYSPVIGEDGRPSGVISIVVETTAKVRAERRLSGERERLRQMFEQAPGFMALLSGKDHVFDLTNPAYQQLIGHRDVIGKPVREALPEVVNQGFIDFLDRVYDRGEPFIGRGLEVALRRNPSAPEENRFVDLVYQPLKNETGEVTGIFVEGVDVTERVRAEAAIRESEERFRLLTENAPVKLWMSDAEGRCAYLNQAQRRFWGLEGGDVGDFDWSETIHPDDRDALFGPYADAMRDHLPFSIEARYRRHDGEYRVCHTDARPRFDVDGSFLGMIGVNVDITKIREAENKLRQLNEELEDRVVAEVADRRQAEIALQKAQKMEAIGKLTGGIAHDFNNLLQVISGNLQLLERDVAGNERAERRVRNAMAGVQRGAKLASHLLAFGRRQPLEPKVVSVGRLVQGMEDMLRRSIGEDIEIQTMVSGGLWNAFADPGQIENAVLNLAINARDAMPRGGKLTIEVQNAFIDDTYILHNADAVPGQYVMLAVSDTGTGMSPEILAQVFEPFFSTKPEGKGSGLGLSMVYGFAKQTGGHVKIYSEEGHGTTVKLYLPRINQDEEVEKVSRQVEVSAGDETVLVVEDDPDVRATAIELLTGLGYKVLEAKDAGSALAIIESGAAIDLLFTDVVMPGKLRSPELARRATRILPEMGVLFTSGYTENAIVHGGRLDEGVDLLSKPYTRDALARKVRQVLAKRKAG